MRHKSWLSLCPFQVSRNIGANVKNSPCHFCIVSSIVQHKYEGHLGETWTSSQRCRITPIRNSLSHYVSYVPFEIVYQVLYTLNKLWQLYGQGTTQLNFIAESDSHHHHFSRSLFVHTCIDKWSFVFLLDSWNKIFFIAVFLKDWVITSRLSLYWLSNNFSLITVLLHFACLTISLTSHFDCATLMLCKNFLNNV